MSVAAAMRDHAYDAMSTLARYAEQVEKEACTNRQMPDDFCFERNGEMIPPSDMVCHVWDKVDEMLQSIKAPNNVAGQKRRTTDPDWCDTDRFRALKEANIAKLVAMTDAAARLGQDVIEQTAFAAWKNLLESPDPETRAEAQRLFDKELGLPAPPLPGLGASQTTAGQVLDGTLSSAKRPKYAVLSANESAAVGDGEAKYHSTVGIDPIDGDVKYRPTVVMDEDEETPRYNSLAGA